METSNEWIIECTGIEERRWVVEGETGATLATAASKELKSHNAADGGLTLGAKNLYELIANAPGDEITLNSARWLNLAQ